jgi:hypothetical protein
MSLLSEREATAGEVSASRQELDCRNMPTMAGRPFESRETIHVYLDVDHEAERSGARLGRSEIGGVIAITMAKWRLSRDVQPWWAVRLFA